MNEPLISIIIPVYNVEPYLDMCVKSVANQTYRNLEIILVDDGSPDGCPHMCDVWAAADPRIRVIHKENGGLSSARNAGLDIAAGEYIGFVDSDDYVAENMYEVLLSALQDSGAQISICYPYTVSEEGNISNPEKIADKGVLSPVDALSLVFQGQINQSVWSRLFHKRIFDNIRFPVGETNEDIPLAIPMFTAADRVVNTGEALYFYRARPGSITHSYWNTDAYIVLKHLIEIQQQIEYYRLWECKSSYTYFAAESAFFTALHLEQNYERISDTAKENHRKYLILMKRYLFSFMLSKYPLWKHKVLYLMVLTRTLRPIYKALGKNLH